jgi:hypothetical protein
MQPNLVVVALDGNTGDILAIKATKRFAGFAEKSVCAYIKRSRARAAEQQQNAACCDYNPLAKEEPPLWTLFAFINRPVATHYKPAPWNPMRQDYPTSSLTRD